MKVAINLLISGIVAIWIGVIAVVSIQNITPISLRFLFLRSIEIPLGVVLALSVGVGLSAGAIAPLLLPKPPPQEEEDPLENWSDLE